jgi:hypothetical protein
MDICLSPARAAASRRNGARACWGEGPQPLPGPGARSRGPKTPEGKARSAQNALKHGMRAQQCIVLPGERAAAFAAFEAALLADLAPQGALQTVLAQRIVAASWRLARAERLAAGTGLGPRSPTRRPRRPSCSARRGSTARARAWHSRWP